jgi:hypothetical protein
MKRGQRRQYRGIKRIEKGVNPGTELIWESFELSEIPTKNLPRLEGLEPPTLGSEDRCSVQLSYRRFDGLNNSPVKLIVTYPGAVVKRVTWGKHCRGVARISDKPETGVGGTRSVESESTAPTERGPPFWNFAFLYDICHQH